mgnify:CR=1 FL=1
MKNVPETHKNLVGLLDGFNLKKFGFILGDLKIVRMVYGMQPCSAKFSCPWCHGTAPFDQKHYKLRTFKSLRENCKGFKDQVAKISDYEKKRLKKIAKKKAIKEQLRQHKSDKDNKQKVTFTRNNKILRRTPAFGSN